MNIDWRLVVAFKDLKIGTILEFIFLSPDGKDSSSQEYELSTEYSPEYSGYMANILYNKKARMRIFFSTLEEFWDKDQLRINGKLKSDSEENKVHPAEDTLKDIYIVLKDYFGDGSADG